MVNKQNSSKSTIREKPKFSFSISAMTSQLLIAVALISSVSAQDIITNCQTNSECEAQIGQGACCLYEKSLTTNFQSYNCRNQDFVNYYYNPRNYDTVTNIWTNPENAAERMVVFCRPMDVAQLPFKYPYVQPWANYTTNNRTNVTQYDQINRNIRSDMFFMPRPVLNWGDQVLKWISAVVWFWTPVPAIVLTNNLIWYTFDFFQYDNNPSTKGVKFSMYDNILTAFFMQNQDLMWGPFQWYDMFSLDGFQDWFMDSIMFHFFPWYMISYGFIRQQTNDWTIGTVERNNQIDKNRIFGRIPEADPYDFKYWSTKEDGVDCNGNVGYGFYCYCPSQGYQCTCTPNNWYQDGQVRNMCNDHYGYNCDGQYVDGEANWCMD